MKYISKLAAFIAALALCSCLCLNASAAYLNGGSQKYMYSGVVIASLTYTCDADGTSSQNLWWTVYDQSAGKRDWPASVQIRGAIVYETHYTGTALCSLTDGVTYDIRIVSVLSTTEAPYFYMMIEGEGVTPRNLGGEYQNGVWISEKQNFRASKITTGDGIDEIHPPFNLDYVIVTDGDTNPDRYYDNISDFRKTEYTDGAVHTELLWIPNADTLTTDNVKVYEGEREIPVDRIECNGSIVSIWSKEFCRGSSYRIELGENIETCLGAKIRIPLSTQFSIPYNDTDVMAVTFGDSSVTVTAKNETDAEATFVMLTALKSDSGAIEKMLVSDMCTISPHTESEDFTFDGLNFEGLIPEVFMMTDMETLLPFSDRSFSY